MSHREWLDRAPAYALDALGAEERRAFEAHLSKCDRCAAAVAGFRETMADLATAVPPAEPPPELRERILSAARRAEAARGDDPAAGRAPDGGSAAGVVAFPTWRRVLPWAVAAAATFVAVWAGIYGVGKRAESRAYEAELEEARAQVLALEAGNARRDSMLAALAARDLETATLVRTEGAAEPRVRLFRDRARDVLLVTVFDLPPAPAGRTYQLWGIAPDRDPVSLGVFDTGAEGEAVLLADATDVDFELSAVTEEPAGGSPQPTTPPFLAGEWTAGP